MNYLITGGRGFIGCHVIRQLLRRGNNRILCTDSSQGKTSIHEVLTPEELSQVEFLQADLSSDCTDLLTKIMIEYKIDKVIHLAAILGDIAERDPALAVRVNILGTISVFEAALAAGVKRVVWACSQSSFGTNVAEKSVREDHSRGAAKHDQAVFQPVEEAHMFGDFRIGDHQRNAFFECWQRWRR